MFASKALWNVGWRYLLVHRRQSLMMILGVALGVAVVVSIDLANASAGRAFDLSTEAITGRATHQVTGGPRGVEESVYTRLRIEVPAVTAAPVISEMVSSPRLGGRPLQLLGVDPFSDAPFRSYWGRAGAAGPDLAALTAFLTRPGAVLIAQTLAERYHLAAGDVFSLVVGGRERSVFVAGLLRPADALSRRALEGVILADIATAQELIGQSGYLTRIDLILPAADPQAAARLEAWLPPDCRLEPASARAGSIREMTQAFQLNLTALSLLALVVGLFLIYNTMTFSVVQRRALFGMLRCLGVARREVFALVLGEALAVGVIGSLVGIGLGLLLGQVTVRMVTQTVNDLYFTTTVQAVGIDPASLLKGAALGLLATALTAALPAWEAASAPPRAVLLRSGLEAQARSRVGLAALAGLGSGALGLAIFSVPSNSLALGFSGTLAVVLGFALLSSAFLVILARIITPLSGRLFGLIGRMAARNLVNALSRTAVAVAALMVAVAVIIGVGLMIDSFRHTVIVWLEQTLQGDVYISVPNFNATRSSVALDPAVVKAVRSWPGVAEVDSLRAVTADARSGGRAVPVNLAATENPRIGRERLFAHLQGAPDGVWGALQAGAVIVSEPLANRLGLTGRSGEQVELWMGAAWRAFPVTGIYYDYASSQGTVMMALDVYRSYWQDDALTALSLHLQPGTDPDQLARGLQDALGSRQHLLVRPNAALRRDVLAVFDRTFAITVALRMLATLVAFIGILNALLLLQFEKQREVGILRALGLTGRQLWRLVMIETGLMGLAAGLLAIPAGYALALILVFVINRRSFGWTLQMALQPEVFLQAAAIALAAALLAGIYPAMRLSRMAAAEAIRYE